ncbi:MAG TPA: hypothetical protein PKK00_05610 [Bacteroidales bacterium]|nr:hypothetical protein [Bacteroidales bacterium]HPS16360.1 hypothetical protein [Bacteroidales bacterium]
MKKVIFKLAVMLFILQCGVNVNAQQNDSLKANDTIIKKLYIVTKNDGAQYVGYILKNDEREVLIETKEMGKLYIPKYEIKKIEEVTEKNYSSTNYDGADLFGTRYFINTNGLPTKRKDDSYVSINYYGPDINFCVGDNFSLGVMTTWACMPIVGYAKQSISLSENLNLGIGAYLGTLSWIKPKYFGGMCFGSLTYGNRRNNIMASGGYAFASLEDEVNGITTLSLAGIVKTGKKTSFVVDSYFFVGDENVVAVVIPGFRFSKKQNRAFQFGFAGIIADDFTFPIPIPFMSWMMKF